MNPTASIEMKNGARIEIELLPEAAPNTVNSFIYLAENKAFDDYAIQRIVPGNWVDISYSAFGKDICKYLIPLEFDLHPEITPVDSVPGCVCMGGYDEGISGGEFFFPLRACPDHKGKYPVFGRVLSGFDEIIRIAGVPTRKVEDFPLKDIEVNEPLTPEIIKKVEINLNGYKYSEPVKLDAKIPEWW